MNFRRRLGPDEPEINLIPLIDVLLVILIFLAITTSFTRLNQLEVDLPQATALPLDTNTINVAISEDGVYTLDGVLLPDEGPEGIAAALRGAAEGRKDALLLISADAMSTHLSVVRILQAARLANISRVNFATRTP